MEGHSSKHVSGERQKHVAHNSVHSSVFLNGHRFRAYTGFPRPAACTAVWGGVWMPLLPLRDWQWTLGQQGWPGTPRSGIRYAQTHLEDVLMFGIYWV